MDDSMGAYRPVPSPYRMVRGLLGRIGHVRRSGASEPGGGDQVWRTLERLVARDPSWQLLRAPSGSAGPAREHLLLGPGGVFAVHVVDHPLSSVWVEAESVKVDGTSTPHLRAVHRAADGVQAVLDTGVAFAVRVEPLLVVARCTHLTLKRAPAGVAVLAQDGVEAFLRSRPSVLAPSQAQAVAQVVAGAPGAA